MATRKTETAAEAMPTEFETGKFLSESRYYDMAIGQQTCTGELQTVTFHEEVAEEDAIVMLDDPKAVAAYMEAVGSKGYTLGKRAYKLVGGKAVATRYKAVDARIHTR